MVTRRQKLLAAVVVLALGFGLAWPLRRTEPLRPASAPTAVEALSQPVVLDEPLSPQSPVQAALGVGGSASGPRDPFAQDADGASPPFSQVSDPAPPALAAAPSGDERRIHVVHQGDSLDRLAARYLGDEARALEIFDLNRDVLENPHLLPIGAELRIPGAASAID